MNLLKSHKSLRSALGTAALLFVLVSGLLIAVDQLSIRFGLDGWRRVADDLLGGLVAGSIFYLYEHQRLRRFAEHLQLIDLMNHHIRNALQPLMFVPYGSEGKMQMKVVEECVHRIDWALREVLPGKSGEQFVLHTRQFAQSSNRTPGSLAESVSLKITPRRQPASGELRPFFTRWLDNWKNRNEKAS